MEFVAPRRYHWPKVIPPLTDEQIKISNDFMRHWHEILPNRYGVIDKFNHTYPVRAAPSFQGCKTVEIGAGIGEHLDYETLEGREYYCVELRENMAERIRERYPSVNAFVGNCQERLPFADRWFDRAIAIHVLEHLPDLPRGLDELARVLKPTGKFAIVIPCDPGLAYGFARAISAERIFWRRYKQKYSWFINREHINSTAEIVSELKKRFTISSRTYFPLSLPMKDVNLCLGMVGTPLET